MDIPGYYFDAEKNRYFKLMKTGEHSEAAVLQRRRQQEQAQRDRQQARVRGQKYKPVLTMHQFAARRTMTPFLGPRALFFEATASLATHLHADGRAQTLEVPQPAVSATKQISHAAFDPSTGQLTTAGLDGQMVRFCYQTDPFFASWPCSAAWSAMAPVTSLQYGPMCELDGCRTQFLMATTMGHARSPNGLWRFRLALPEALNEEQAGQLMENQEQARRVLVDPLQLPTAQDDSSYDARKDTFWASHWSYDHNVVLIGSAKGLTILNGSFDLADRISTKSDVFATQLSASQPRIAWIGCRNGHLALVDSRKPNAEARKPSLRFKHASSITHLQPLDDWASGHGVLAASMNGHVALWDTRFSKRPTRQFIDHRNEHTRNLGFDVDTTATFSVAIAGVDNKVRVWSLLDHQQTVAPAWTSDDFHRPIPSIALQHTPPPRHAAWTHLNHEKHASLPGLLVCTSDQQHTPELHWFSV